MRIEKSQTPGVYKISGSAGGIKYEEVGVGRANAIDRMFELLAWNGIGNQTPRPKKSILSRWFQ